MRKFFNPESFLWKPFGFIGELVMLSLLWLVCAIPLVTLGASSAALYDATMHTLRRRDEMPIPRFFSTFRRELKQGILTTLVALAAGAVFFFAPLLVFDRQDGWPYVIAAWVLLGFFLLCFLCWLWPVLSRFTMELGPLLGASLRLALGHILRSAAMAVLWGAVLYTGLRFAAPFFICPALAALACTHLIEPVFRKYENTQGQ